LVVTAALALTYNITKETIEARAASDAESARKEVLADADSFSQLDEGQVESIIESNPELNLIKEVYQGVKADKIAGYVFSVTNKGYGGEIDVIIGIDAAGTITGVKVSEHNETAGLGSKATEQAFLSRFTGIAPKGALNVVKIKGSDKDEDIAAVSGATISSKAIVGAAQAALDFYRELIKQGGVS
jgi:electron transport complex protein RnfG